MQVEVSSRAMEIFPNLVVASAATDPTTDEDPRADNMGMPFTETEDEEEWVEWVNLAEGWRHSWAALARPAPKTVFEHVV